MSELRFPPFSSLSESANPGSSQQECSYGVCQFSVPLSTFPYQLFKLLATQFFVLTSQSTALANFDGSDVRVGSNITILKFQPDHSNYNQIILLSRSQPTYPHIFPFRLIKPEAENPTSTMFTDMTHLSASPARHQPPPSSTPYNPKLNVFLCRKAYGQIVKIQRRLAWPLH
jgi:hypothetical protein